MKLLLDQNISFKLARSLRSVADVLHVGDVGLAGAGDEAIWEYAATHSYIIVSKDSDFLHRAILYGPLPKVIYLRLGNASTKDILQCLKQHMEDIKLFERTSGESVLILRDTYED